MRSRVIAAGSAAVLAGVMMLGGVGAAHASTTPAPDAGTAESGTVTGSALSPQLEQIVASGAAPGTAEAAAAGSVPVTGTGSLQTDAAGRLVVTATFSATPTAATLDALGALGAEIVAVSPVLPKVTVYIAAEQLEALAALPGLTGVAADLASGASTAAPGTTAAAATVAASGTAAASAVITAPRSATAAAPAAGAAPAPASCRTIPVDVDPGLKSDQARAAFGVDGTGVTVGIISTSFDTSTTAVTDEADDIRAGLLPGPGNPCGYEVKTRVLGDDPVSTDEGRGMAQMVHGVAPGAHLLFHSGTISATAFSSAVYKLTDAGADVIVDDLSILTEPMYQEGEAGLAIDYAVRHGVLFLSAAGNYSEYGLAGLPDEDYAIGGWESTVYSPMECPAAVSAQFASAIDCHDFGTAGGVGPKATNYIAATNNSQDSFTLLMNWAEPVNGVTGNYVPVLLDKAGEIIVDDKGDPISVGSRIDNSAPVSGVALTLPQPDEYFVVIVRELGAYAPVTAGFKFVFPEDEAQTVQAIEFYQNTDTVTVGPNIWGHTADPDVISVGASYWRAPTVNDAFSSIGPVKHLFGPIKTDGSASDVLPAPVILDAPDITSLDGAQTSFFETEISPGVYVFFGTSAASPNAAGVAALAMQYSPQSSAAEVRRAMTETAVPLELQYRNIAGSQVYGSGLVDALATLSALPAAPAPAPQPAGDGSTALAATGSGAVAPGALGAGLLAVLALVAGAAAVAVRRGNRGRVPARASR